MQTLQICRRGRVRLRVQNFAAQLDPMTPAILDGALGPAVVGGSAARGAAHGRGALMVTANIFDHTKRKRSFEILAKCKGG